MSNLNFKYGLVGNLPQTLSDGTIYVTTDERAMYIDLPVGPVNNGSPTVQRLRLGDFRIYQNINALRQAAPDWSPTTLVYLIDEDLFARYEVEIVDDLEHPGTQIEQKTWKPVNSQEALRTSLNTLSQNLSSLSSTYNTDKTSLLSTISDIQSAISELQGNESSGDDGETLSLTALNNKILALYTPPGDNTEASGLIVDNADDIATNASNIATNTSNIAAEVTRAQAAEAALTTNLNSLQSDVTGLGTDINGLDTRLSTTETTITSQGTRLSTAETTITSQGTRLSTAETTITSQGTRLSTAETNITALQTDLNGLGTDVDGLDTRLSTAETNITSQGTRLSTAETNITSQGTRLSTAETNITSQGTRLSTAETNITSLQTDLNGLSNDLEDAIDDLEEEIDLKLQAADAMTFKGVVNQTLSTPIVLPTAITGENAVQAGDTYKVAGIGTYAGVNAKVGDLFIALTDSADLPEGTETYPVNQWTHISSGYEDDYLQKFYANASGGATLYLTNGVDTDNTNASGSLTFTSDSGINVVFSSSSGVAEAAINLTWSSFNN